MFCLEGTHWERLFQHVTLLGFAMGKARGFADASSCGNDPLNRDLLYVRNGGDAGHIVRMQ